MLKVDNKGANNVMLVYLLFLLRSGVFILNFEHISYLFPVFRLLTLSK